MRRSTSGDGSGSLGNGMMLGPPPWVVKDRVKSAKERWHRACFVPAHADFQDFTAVCVALLEYRGDRFECGFVIKQYVELATLPGYTPERAA